MTTPNPDHAARHADRILAAARAVLADPDSIELRRRFLQAMFNIDWTAAAIVTLAERGATP